MITLRGMTWDHPRGYDPLVACDAIWRERAGVAVVWDRRSLQDFEAFPIEELAETYDLLVIDHPHVGLVAEQGCLAPFDQETDSVGPTLESYRWAGRLWALPIDAATQVMCRRPDLTPTPPRGWDDALDLARQGKALLPLRPPHALMCVMTLSADLGHPCGQAPGVFIAPDIGVLVIERLRELAALVDPACFDMDPIAVLERMAAPGDAACCAPLIYGYVSYARENFRPRRLAFSDIPLPGARGGALGGAGIAVSARSPRLPEAVATARWIAGPEAQAGAYAAAGGQPAHLAAWRDEALDAACGGFFSATRLSLERSYVRPRDAGYMAFQGPASARVADALRDGDAAAAVGDLNAAFAAR